MPRAHSNSKRLAKNILFVNIRIIAITIIGLVSTRVTFQALGQSEYGLYNVVAGIIAVLGIISTAMTTTTRRFINYEMGNPECNLNKIFNGCFKINLAFAFILFILSETIGLFYIYNYLKVEPRLFTTSIVIFHISTITSVISIINVPYQSLMAAYEKFYSIAIIDVVVTLVKLLGVVSLFLFTNNRLIIYAILMSVVTLLGLIIYYWFCKYKWPNDIRLRRYDNRTLYKKIFIFNNYIVLGACSYIGRAQGSNLLINYFFGTIVNGAFSIAYMIENYAMMAIGNLTTAAGPQITKEYSAGNRVKAIQIASKINRLSILGMLSLVFIAIVELPYILKMWLGVIPVGCVDLCRWTLISAAVRSFSEGLPPLTQASGKIKWFQIVGSITQVSVLILGWLLFKHGYPPDAIIISFAIVSVINFCITLMLMRIIITPNEILTLVRNSFIPTSYALISYVAYILIVHLAIENINPIVDIAFSIIYAFCIIILVGLTRNERTLLIKFLSSTFHSK